MIQTDGKPTIAWSNAAPTADRQEPENPWKTTRSPGQRVARKARRIRSKLSRRRNR